jgi:hypothetical protein
VPFEPGLSDNIVMAPPVDVAVTVVILALEVVHVIAGSDVIVNVAAVV